jgi:hypothetical protein
MPDANLDLNSCSTGEEDTAIDPAWTTVAARLLLRRASNAQMAISPAVGLAKRVANGSFGLVRYEARTARYWLSGEALGRFFTQLFLGELAFLNHNAAQLG